MTHQLAKLLVAIVSVGVVSMACSNAAPGPSTQATSTAVTSTAAPATATAGAQTAPPPSVSATEGPVPPTPAEGSTTTFTLVMADGPRMGTWEVTYDGEVPACKYLPDLERWIATWLGPPPVTYIDVIGEADSPLMLVTFDSDLPTENGFLPTGDTTFEVDDRGDTATLTFVSATNEWDFEDGSPSVTSGPAELTVECGAVFRYE